MMVSCCVIKISAQTKTANVIGTDVAIRTEPNTKTSTVLIRVSNVEVTVNSSLEGEQAESGGTKTWYNVTYKESEKKSYTGYIYGKYISFPPSSDDYVYDEDFEKNIQNFPESYRDALRALHSKYPNWKFVAHNVNMDFNTAVDLQYSPSDVNKRKKMVELSYGGNEWRDIRSYNEATGVWTQSYPGWTYASRAAIAYFVDPRNYLTEKYIFAFLEQSYNKEIQTKDGLRTVVANTFLAKGYDNDADAYLDDLILAAEQSGISPYVLAAAIILEVGVNGSTVTSGTYSGYEGYYNFYNWNATGSDVIGNALSYAKQQGWNSREAAIVGGAKLYADGYVNAGQDTYYYKNFNYVTSQSVDHQYAESVYASRGDAIRISSGFLDNTNGTATFKIPVFKNMSDTASPIPTTVETPQPTPPPEPEPVIKKGDISGDDKINAVDLAAVKMHILGVKKLENNAFKASDINDDGTINAVDLAAVKMHILGVKTIS